jgi:hypothetical protein
MEQFHKERQPSAVVREFIIDNTTAYVLLLSFFNLWGEVRLSSVGMPATVRRIVPALDDG